MNNMLNKYFALMLGVSFFVSCSDDDPSPEIDKSTYTGTISINPNNFPAGGALSLAVGDTGRVVQLDDEPNFAWDVLIITYKTANGGRPGILLKGDVNSTESVMAVDVSAMTTTVGLGSSGFTAFTTISDEMIAGLKEDGVFNFDPAVDVDANGKPDETKLLAAYADLIIGDKTVNLAETEQPVYLIKTAAGLYFKLQLVTREGGGDTTLRWSRMER